MKTVAVIHPAYRDTLNLRNVLLSGLDPNTPLRQAGLLEELPGGLTLDCYYSKLKQLREQLKTLPTGESHAEEYALTVGEVIKLCLFRALTNVEMKVRTEDGRVIKRLGCLQPRARGILGTG